MYRDNIDEKIIEFLRNDSRESFVDIRKKFTVEVGAGNSTSAIVLISVESSMDTSKVSSKLTKLPGVKTVYEITGQYDITVVISAPNISEINGCIDALRKIPGVSDTNTVIILRTVT